MARRDYKVPYGQISSNRVAWADLSTLRVIIYKPEQAEDAMEPGEPLVIQFRKVTNRGMMGITLTDMTTEELEMFKDMVDKAVEMARPVCESRDEMARRSFEELGNESPFVRHYRPVPHMVDRTGVQQGDRSGLPQRSRSLDGMGRRPGVEAPEPPVVRSLELDTDWIEPDELDTAF